jgi:endogenous inhibitor of DNA gyrase (YacG/DUF329 family)
MAKMEATMLERRKVCQWCGKPFVAQRKSTMYCSARCRMNGWRQEQKRLALDAATDDLLED